MTQIQIQIQIEIQIEIQIQTQINTQSSRPRLLNMIDKVYGINIALLFDVSSVLNIVFFVLNIV